jgi:hypothetical protein
MVRVSPPAAIAVRRKGFKVRTIARLKFEPGPAVVGWVNYNNKVCPVFTDPNGKLFLNADGWASTQAYPLTRGDEDDRGEDAEFRF